MECNAVHLDKDKRDDFTPEDLSQQLQHMRTILANSTFNINEIVSKSTSIIDTVEDEFIAFNRNSRIDYETEKITVRDDDGRISLAYERLTGVPQTIADVFASRTHTLDLSYNNLKDLSFLTNFGILHTLILDNNVSIYENTLPYLSSLRILWLNKCEIFHLSKWMQRIRIHTPNLRQLSLMGNPGVRSLINGCSSLENYDYMMCVIRALPRLDYLDDVKISDGQRAMAKAYISARTIDASLVHSKYDFSSTPNLLNLRKYDVRIRRNHNNHGNVSQHSMNRTYVSKQERI